MGLILFGTNAYLQAPLTFDNRTVQRFLQEARLGFAGKETAIHVAGLEARGDFVVDDAPGEQVGEPPFEAVADFDAYYAFLAGHQQQHTIVVLLLAEAPGAGDAQGIILEGLTLKRRYGENGNLGRIALLHFPEGPLQAQLGLGRDHPRQVVDMPAQRRDVEGCRCTRYTQQQEQDCE